MVMQFLPFEDLYWFIELILLTVEHMQGNLSTTFLFRNCDMIILISEIISVKIFLLL